MSKLRQVLRLYCQGQSKLHISNTTGLSRNTIKKYLRIFKELRLTLDQVESLKEKALLELFCKEPVPLPSDKLTYLYRYFEENEKQLRKRGVTIQFLFERYRNQNPEGYAQTAFYYHFNLWKKRVEVTMRIEHKAGDKMYIDFAGEKLKVVDRQSGEIIQVEVFVAILGASQLTYVEAVASQKVEDLISACENALCFFGGSPSAIVPDNLKSAVTQSNRYEPRINENFELFASHYSMSVLPARAYKPKDKAHVENAVKIAYRRIYANLPDELSGSLEELNAAILSELEKHNTKTLTGRNYSRLDQFKEMEQAALNPLPELRFELRKMAQVTVMKNGHVCLSEDKHYYSVPFTFIGRKVRLLYSKSKVEVYYKYDMIAVHTRLRSPHNYTTDPSHMATEHRVLVDWNPDLFLSRAREIHPDVAFYIDQVLLKKKHPEQAYKSCQGILSYARRVGNGRLIKACQRAHEYGLYNFRIIENILTRGLDRYDDEMPPDEMPQHDNIRGKSYYQ
jgi:transposase